jgi:ABC-type enterochelin transport system permease subunit
MHFVQRRIDQLAAVVSMGGTTIVRSERAITMSSTRIFLGSVAGAISVLIFHQTILQVFFWVGLAPQAAFRVAHVPPFNMPMVVSITFWGAVYGGLFGLVAPRLKGRLWLNGMALGMCAMLIAWFVFLPLKSQPMAWGWEAWPMARSLIAYLLWGAGVGLILPLLHPRGMGATRPPFGRPGLAT